MVMRDGATAPTSPIDLQREFPGTNSARLLRMLYRNGNRSRADLARAVGFTKATVARESVQRDGDTGDAALAKTKNLIDSLLARATRRVLGIGICAPGIVDPAGVVVASHNLGWWGLPLRREVLAHTGLPTEVENDANAAALAELDTVDDLDDLLLVKVGFGVGGAIIANGRLIHGPGFTAGEIGHVSIDGTGPQCVCGRFGCLEATLAQPRLEATLRGVEGAAAREGVLEDAGRRLGVALAPLVGAFGMSSVVVSGPPVLVRINLPLVWPGIVTAIVFTFVSCWNEFAASLVILSTAGNQPLSVALTKFVGHYETSWHYVFGVAIVAIVAIVPVVVLFMLIEKRLVSGLTAGSVK